MGAAGLVGSDLGPYAAIYYDHAWVRVFE